MVRNTASAIHSKNPRVLLQLKDTDQENEPSKPSRKPRPKALQEIRRLQKRQDPDLIPVSTIRDLVRERLVGMGREGETGVRLSHGTVFAIRVMVERMALAFAEDIYRAALHAGRVTVMEKDYDFIMRLIPERDHDNLHHGTYRIKVNGVRGVVQTGVQGRSLQDVINFLSTLPSSHGKSFARHWFFQHDIKFIRPTHIRRLFRMAGCRRVSSALYRVMIGYIEGAIADILETAIVMMDYAKRSTLKCIDIIHGCGRMQNEPQTLVGMSD